MANQVFANNMEVSCKAAMGKAICAFPDVCFTPPENPATPTGVPIPYPNTGMASDTTSGTTTVKISGQEVMLKNKSYFKQSYGDEAGCAAKKGVLTSVNRGKVYFNAWSMDVHFEGENVVRNLDLTTHNHASFPGNSPTWPYLDEMAVNLPPFCQEDAARVMLACGGFKDKDEICKALEPLPYPKRTPTGKPKQSLQSPESRQLSRHNAANACMNARRCFLQPYDPSGCCSPQTPHHLIEASALFDKGRGGAGSQPLQGVNTGSVKYNENKAPCVCAEGTSQSMDGTHGWMHTHQSVENAKRPAGVLMVGNGSSAQPQSFDHVTTYKDAKANAIAAMQKVFPGSACNPKCLEQQLDNYHAQCGIQDSTPIKAVVEGNTKPGEGLARAQSGIEECAQVAPEPAEIHVGLAGAADGGGIGGGGGFGGLSW